MLNAVMCAEEEEEEEEKKKKKIPHRQRRPLRGNSPPLQPLSRRGLNPNKLVYDPSLLRAYLK